MAKKKKLKFYTVWVGRNPGVYSSWEECQLQINGFENAIYKSFSTKEEAEAAFKADSKDYIGVSQFKTSLSESELSLIGVPVENSICVDGAWNTATNAIEYQGVILPQKSMVFHAGPFSAGTNNIAEFLAIVHALTYCQKNPNIPAIYSDSRTAISWVKRKKAATKIISTAATAQIIAIVHRAEDWLHKNPYNTPVLKWETLAWGENPADFGRK
jgi:ribonuclease HI